MNRGVGSLSMSGRTLPEGYETRSHASESLRVTVVLWVGSSSWSPLCVRVTGSGSWWTMRE